MLAELCRMFADLRRADQQLERTAEPATAAGDDQVVDPPLSGCHFAGCDVAITGHSILLSPFAYETARSTKEPPVGVGALASVRVP